MATIYHGLSSFSGLVIYLLSKCVDQHIPQHYLLTHTPLSVTLIITFFGSIQIPSKSLSHVLSV